LPGLGSPQCGQVFALGLTTPLQCLHWGIFFLLKYTIL